MNSKLRAITFSLLTVLVLFNIGVFVFLLGALKDSETATLKMMRAKEIATVSSNLSKRLYDAGVALGGLSMTKSHLFSTRFDKSIRQIPVDVTELKDLIDQRNAVQFDALMKVAELLPDAIKSMGDAREQIMTSKETGVARGRSFFGQMHSKAEAIQKSLQVIVDDSKELANAKIPTRLAHFETITMMLIIGALGNLILGVALAVSINKMLQRQA